MFSRLETSGNKCGSVRNKMAQAPDGERAILPHGHEIVEIQAHSLRKRRRPGCGFITRAVDVLILRYTLLHHVRNPADYRFRRRDADHHGFSRDQAWHPFHNGA